MNINNTQIAIIGLGYVGLPLALEFSKKYKVFGFDININRIKELKNGIDKTKEVQDQDLHHLVNIHFTNEINEITNCNIFIITVPTPIDKFKAPDLKPLLEATKMIGKIIKEKDIIIYESTVYPGCTEEDCVPVLEKVSGLKFNEDFYCGYSPERINPGDKINTLVNIKKVTSGSTPEIANVINDLYASIIIAGTYLAPSISVAEASKAIENAQRDINISFINELALIFEKMGIDTNDVLDAAATKWNFLKYKPGLVGGHCIGVDPYYLAHKSESLGYYPQVILSGRRVNDNMGIFVANKMIKLLIENNVSIKGAKVLILGITFKENCPDIRNSKVIDVYNELIQFGVNVDVLDPHADTLQVFNEYKINLTKEISNMYSGLILAVAHDEFLNIDYTKFKIENNCIIYDLKSFLDRNIVTHRL
jgi:UDP-N-acetyl-D-galactosamine dehydrogenase